MQRTVKIKNMVNSTVVVRKPEYNINREWKTLNQIVQIPYETVEQLLWDIGFRNMIEGGVLSIVDMKDKIDLGLEAEGTTEATNIIELSQEEINNIWTKKTYDEFVEYINDLPKVYIDNIIEYAIRNDIVDVKKANYIKKLTSIDILTSISRKHEMED